MFGMDQFAMMQKMKEAAEESKRKLDSMLVSGEAGGGLIVVEMSGNRKLKNIQINADLQHIEKEDLEDLLVVALDKALEKANQINEQEVANSAKQFLPGI